MYRFIWRNLLERKLRTGLSMLGVAIGVAGIVAMISVAKGVLTSLDSFMETSGASLTVFNASAAGLEYSDVPAADIERIRGLDGVLDVARSNFMISMSPRIGGRRASMPMLLCFGRLPEERLMARYRESIVDGHEPENRSQVLVGSLAAEMIGLKPGMKLPLFGREFEVAGVFNAEISWENAGVLLHADVLGEVLGRPDSYSLVYVFTRPEDADAVKRRIEKACPELIAVPPAEFTKRFADWLEYLEGGVVLISLVAITFGVLGVFNTMMMSVSERTREIGMLRALGWSRGRVVRLILAEGVLLSSIGGLAGLLLGYGATEAMIRAWPEAWLVARYEGRTFLWGALAALVTGMLAAAYPAWRASSLRPVEALRYE